MWCLACSTPNYVWNFEVYYGKDNPQVEDPIANLNVHPICLREPKLAYNVVLKMVNGLANVGHLMAMNNFFSSIGLFIGHLLSMGIYAIGTVRPNRVELPMNLKDTKCLTNSE